MAAKKTKMKKKSSGSKRSCSGCGKGGHTVRTCGK